MHCASEHLASLLGIPKHVEARAARRQEDHVPGNGAMGGLDDGIGHPFRRFGRTAAAERLQDLSTRISDVVVVGL